MMPPPAPSSEGSTGRPGDDAGPSARRGSSEGALGAADVAWLLVAVLVTRGAAAFAGVRFQAEHLDAFWHFVDPALLESRLLESLLYLHSQPPLFNLFLGVGLQVFGPSAPTFYAAVFSGLTVVFALTFFALLRAAGLSRRPSLIVVAAFLATPQSILYEQFLFYAHPEMILLCLGALLLWRALERRTFAAWLGFFGALATLTLLRPMFHAVWYVAVAAGAWCCAPAPRAPLLRAAALGAALVLAPYAKNAALFGTFSSSSWLGMSLARMTLRQLPADELEAGVRRGDLSAIARVPPFSAHDRYAGLLPPSEPTGRPLLDAPLKPNGEVNLHHRDYVPIAAAYRRDAFAVLARRPGIYLGSVFTAARLYLQPASTWAPLAPNRARLGAWAEAYEAALHFSWGRRLGGAGLMLLLLPIGALLGAWAARRAFARGDRALGAALLYAAGNIAYVTLTGTLLEIGENYRFRYDTEPLLLFALAAAAAEARRFSRLRARGRGRPGWPRGGGPGGAPP